ncbi:hypothetical protein HMPREF9120_00085 [Neisseria sp. oral taxon 020 str. F0370]|nr:hypothetical protein HMPREF9120_00085 [Neisseria sp. oral taxon 020 str. F0370]
MTFGLRVFLPKHRRKADRQQTLRPSETRRRAARFRRPFSI